MTEPEHSGHIKVTRPMNRTRQTGTLKRVEFGIAMGNKRGACMKLALKDVESRCASLLEGTQAPGGLGT